MPCQEEPGPQYFHVHSALQSVSAMITVNRLCFTHTKNDAAIFSNTLGAVTCDVHGRSCVSSSNIWKSLGLDGMEFTQGFV